jgi:asparagine synthase (glutamine-hydrolysing)
MCGIAGIIQKKNHRVDPTDLVRMLSVQHHRGPDASGITLTHDDRVGFGHVRLSIIDLSTGQQPLWATSGEQVITFNGEVYDHVEHRERLRKDQLEFRTESDTEVIVNLYRRYGLDFVHHLNGEFAFAIWDRSQKLFVAARDRYGVKPFFYRDTSDELLFSSEAKGLLALPRVPRAISREHMMTAMVSVPSQAVSPFEGTRALRPGHLLIWKDGSGAAYETSYWKPHYEKGPRMSHGEAVEKVRDVFKRSVKRRLVADVPVCTFLSGGLDSTLVTAEMKALLGDKPLTSFTIGFVNSDYDESAPATDIARELGVKHEILPVSMANIAEHLEDCVEQVEMHLVNPSSVGKFLLSRHVRDRGFKVALTGEGADELFAGYPYFKLEQIWSRLESQDAATRRAAARTLKEFQKREYRSEGLMWNRTDEWKHAPRPFGFPSFLFSRTYGIRKQIPLLVDFEKNGFSKDESPLPHMIADFKDVDFAGLHQLQASLTIARGQLSGYIIPTLGDRVEMAHSIEGRTPFLDVELAELSFKIPPEYFVDVDQLREKKILHDALGGLLPPAAKDTQKHPFFSPNWRTLYATPRGRDLVETYMSDAALDRVGVFRKQSVKKLRTLWKWMPQGFVSARKIDLFVGVILTTQIMHERLLRKSRSVPALRPERYDSPRTSQSTAFAV